MRNENIYEYFRIEDLSKKPDKPLKLLFKDRPYMSPQDSLRFKTKEDLNKHLDILFLKTKDTKKRSGGRLCRPLYCTAKDWTTDFDTLERKVLNDPLDFFCI